MFILVSSEEVSPLYTHNTISKVKLPFFVVVIVVAVAAVVVYCCLHAHFIHINGV